MLSVAQVLWAVKTAKGLDWEKQVPQVHDQAAYLRYFAWRSGRGQADRTVHARRRVPEARDVRAL